MSYPSFTSAEATVDRFLEILSEHGVDLAGASQDEALQMTNVIEMWRNPALRPLDPRPVLRAAMGFVDLAGKVVRVAAHEDFGELIPHLKMLAKTTVLQNAASPVTDDAGNKVIELYVAALAMTFADEVKLDHPSASKGDNPDVMLTFRSRRWALALKTLHSRSARTIYDNIKRASDQIEACEAHHGLVVLNVKNLLDYNALWPAPATAFPEAAVISDYFRQIGGIIAPLAEITPEDWLAALGPDRKAVPPVMFIGQAAAFAHPTYGDGPHPMAIKGMATYLDPAEDAVGAMRLAKALNDAAQQFT